MSLSGETVRFCLPALYVEFLQSQHQEQFEAHRDLLVAAIQQKVKPRLEPKGNAKSALDAKMRLIESYAGIKKLNEFRMEVGRGVAAACGCRCGHATRIPVGVGVG